MFGPLFCWRVGGRGGGRQIGATTFRVGNGLGTVDPRVAPLFLVRDVALAEVQCAGRQVQCWSGTAGRPWAGLCDPGGVGEEVESGHPVWRYSLVQKLF